MQNNPQSTDAVEVNVDPGLVRNYFKPKDVTYYQVTARDVRHITAVNTAVTVCFAIMTLFIGLLGGCAWDMVQSKDEATVGEKSFVAACGLFAFVAFCAGVYFIAHRKGEIDDLLGRHNLSGSRDSATGAPSRLMLAAIGIVLAVGLTNRIYQASVVPSLLLTLETVAYGIGVLIVITAWWRIPSQSTTTP